MRRHRHTVQSRFPCVALMRPQGTGWPFGCRPSYSSAAECSGTCYYSRSLKVCLPVSILSILYQARVADRSQRSCHVLLCMALDSKPAWNMLGGHRKYALRQKAHGKTLGFGVHSYKAILSADKTLASAMKVVSCYCVRFASDRSYFGCSIVQGSLRFDDTARRLSSSDLSCSSLLASHSPKGWSVDCSPH